MPDAVVFVQTVGEADNLWGRYCKMRNDQVIWIYTLDMKCVYAQTEILKRDP